MVASGPVTRGPIHDLGSNTFTVDLIGRFVCSTWDEAINTGGPPNDVVVIGAGAHGGHGAEKIFRFAREAAPQFLLANSR